MLIRKVTYLILGLVIMMGVYSFQTVQVQEQEYTLKAAFLYRFVDYVDWGNNADDDETFNIAVLGESDILPPLVGISKDKKTRNKKIVVKQYANVNDIGSCQMIFISRNYKLPVDNIIAKSDFKPVLIISEREDDFTKGAHMNFILADNKLKFEVNLNSVTRSGLKISSQLLQHAYLIRR